MDFRVVGDRIAQRTYNEQLLEGQKFLDALKGELPTGAQSAVLAVLMSKIAGTATVENVPGYVGTVTAPPNTGEGLNYPIPSIVVQVDGEGRFVDWWWKSGAALTDWVSFGLSWEHVTENPSTGDGLDRALFTIVWQDGTDNPVLPVALWVKSGVEDTDWSKIWPISPSGSVDTYEVKAGPDDPNHGDLMRETLDSATIKRALVTDPADGNRQKVQFTAVASAPQKIRYYLSDTLGTGDYTGKLLLTANPYPIEADAIDYEEANQSPPWAVFVSAPESPGLAVWQGGVVHAHLRVKLINPQVGRTYKLYTGNGDIVYTAMIWDWTHSDTYQVKESAPIQPTVTTAYADLDFDIPVTALAAGTDGRLGLNLRLRVYVGSDEAAFDNEKLVVRIGGDNASYIDTLFTPSGGFSGKHNHLDGREEDNAHPMESITPGLIRWNTGPAVATVDGLLTLPPKTNAVRISGTDTLLGIATAGLTPGTVIYVETSASRMIRNGGVPPEGYAAFDFHKALGFSASPWAFLAPDNAAMVLELSGSSTWRVLSAPWVEPQRSLWPGTCAVTINTTNAPGLLVLPAGCPGVVYVTGAELRAIAVDDVDGNAQAGPLASLKLHFLNECRLYHDDPLSGWDAGLAARAAKLDLLPPEDAVGDDQDWTCRAKRTMRLVLNTSDTPRTWIREIDQ